MEEIKKRIRGAGIIEIDDGYAFMYRKNVQKEEGIVSYYTVPGGGIEEGETIEEGTIRELKEELGIEAKISKLVYRKENKIREEYFYLCEYLGGEFGTGEGPEFNNAPEYKDRGEYIPVIVKKEEVENINILPPEIKEYIKQLEDKC